MNKFNVGDIIKGGYTNIDKMMTKAKVVKVFDDNIIRIQILEDAFPFKKNDFYDVRSTFFELIKQPKIEITVDGRKTIATKIVDGEVVNTKIARCHPDDEFSFEEGSRIAIERLLELNFEKEEKEESPFFKPYKKMGFNTDNFKTGQVIVIRRNYSYLDDDDKKVFLYFIKDVTTDEMFLTDADGDIHCKKINSFMPNPDGNLEIIEVLKLNEQFK